MPKIKSAKKRMRQGKSHTALNRTHRSKLRSAIKKVRSSAGDEAKAAYADAVRLIDRAGRKRLIHPNAAARLLGLHPNYLHRLIRNLQLRSGRAEGER